MTVDAVNVLSIVTNLVCSLTNTEENVITSAVYKRSLTKQLNAAQIPLVYIATHSIIAGWPTTLDLILDDGSLKNEFGESLIFGSLNLLLLYNPGVTFVQAYYPGAVGSKGHRMEIGSLGLFILPQADLTYNMVELNNYDNVNAAECFVIIGGAE